MPVAMTWVEIPMLAKISFISLLLLVQSVIFSTALFTLLLGIISQLVPLDDFLRWAIFYLYVQLVDKVLP